MTPKRHDIVRYALHAAVILSSAAMVYGLCSALNHRFLRDPAADRYMLTADKLTTLSMYGGETLKRLREQDAVTFDPTSGQRMGETLEYLKQSTLTNILMVGASQLAFVAGDTSHNYHARRVDQVLKRLSDEPVEVYNLSVAGMNAAETMAIMDRATKRVHFDHVVVFLLMHVLQYNSVRPALQNLPYPSAEPDVADPGGSGLGGWLDPSEMNARVAGYVVERLEDNVPFFRRRFPIQQWAAREVLRLQPDLVSAHMASAEASPAPRTAAIVLNGGRGLLNADFSERSDGNLIGWKCNVPEAPVEHVRDETLGKEVAQFRGGHNGLRLRQSVALSGSAGGATLTVRANVHASEPRAYVRLGLELGDEIYEVRHPGDGAWHELTVQHTLPYSFTERVVTVGLRHQNAPRGNIRVSDLALSTEESERVFHYYYVEETAEPLVENLRALLQYLDDYQQATGARIHLVLSPQYQEREAPIYQPEWLYRQFAEIAEEYARRSGFSFIDARAVVPNGHFGMHSSRPVIDGSHFDAEGHKILAAELARRLGL